MKIPETTSTVGDISENRWFSPLAIIFYFSALKLLLHLITSGGYGYFRDELYLIACSEHLDWGYVDHAPLIAWVIKVIRFLLGDSLFALHFIPAVSGALKVFLTGLIVCELGGKRFAIVLSCLCVVLAPGYLATDSLLTMNSFEGIFWTACILCILWTINRSESRYWILFGCLAGAGLMNKHSMVFFGFAVVAGLLLTKARSQFTGKWIWIGGAIAFLIFLPNLIWEWRHDWATIELLRNVQTSGKNVELSALDFITSQFGGMGIFGAPVWIAGLVYFLFDRDGKRFRVLSFTYLVLLILMISLGGKAYYLYPIYPMLFVGGAVWFERLLKNAKKLQWLKIAYPILLILYIPLYMPVVLPILPVETLIRYQEFLGFNPPKSEVSFDSPLPQIFADRLGWPEMVQKVAEAYNTLSPEEKSKAVIFAGNYGQAGAVDFFGPQYGLPKVICPHQNYFLWGPRQYTAEVMIFLGNKRENLEHRFDNIEEAGVVDYPCVMSYERYTIYICRGSTMPLSEVWPSLKFWN